MQEPLYPYMLTWNLSFDHSAISNRPKCHGKEIMIRSKRNRICCSIITQAIRKTIYVCACGDTVLLRVDLAIWNWEKRDVLCTTPCTQAWNIYLFISSSSSIPSKKCWWFSSHQFFTLWIPTYGEIFATVVFVPVCMYILFEYVRSFEYPKKNW